MSGPHNTESKVSLPNRLGIPEPLGIMLNRFLNPVHNTTPNERLGSILSATLFTAWLTFLLHKTVDSRRSEEMN